jgi:glutathione S-transferase
VAWAERRIHGVDEPAVRADLAHLPAHLDRVDRWIEEGVLGGEAPNAADLQIAASLRLLLTLEDLREAIDARPAGKLARRLFADYPGHCPAGALPPPG